MKYSAKHQVTIEDWFRWSICLLLGATLLILFTGCATGTGRGFDYVPLVESAAYTGTVVALTDHPEQRQSFAQAEHALSVLGTSQSIGFADLQQAFTPLLERNIKELRDPRTQLIVENVVILVDAYAGRLDTSKASTAQLQAIALAADRGIARALALTR